MKLYCKCDKCRNEIFFFEQCDTRIALAKKRGTYVKLTCKNCFSERKFHVNDIYTKESKIVYIISSLIFIIGSIIVGYLLINNRKLFNNHYVALSIGSLLAVPVIVLRIMQNHDRTRVLVFNRGYF